MLNFSTVAGNDRALAGGGSLSILSHRSNARGPAVQNFRSTPSLVSDYPEVPLRYIELSMAPMKKWVGIWSMRGSLNDKKWLISSIDGTRTPC